MYLLAIKFLNWIEIQNKTYVISRLLPEQIFIYKFCLGGPEMTKLNMLVQCSCIFISK